jgi:transcriptional regulator with XRE-family HTH domain
MYDSHHSDSNQALARAVKRVRRERGISQEDLAYEARVTVSTLSRIERALSSPTLGTLAQIAYALDLLPSQLVAVAEEYAPALRPPMD